MNDKQLTCMHKAGHIAGVSFPISGRVNVLPDYKKNRPSNNLKLRHRLSYHLIDMLIKFSQNYTFPALLILSQMCFPSKLEVFAKY